MAESIQARVAEVRKRLPLAEMVGRDTKLGGGAKQRRAVCPFHNGKSASFAVYPGEQSAHCFGCQWHGDVIAYVRDRRGLSFLDALAECEREAGLAEVGALRSGAGPILRERNPQGPPPRRSRELIEPIELGRFLWRAGRSDPAAVRRYFAGRGVPGAVLTDERLAAFRFVGLGPVMPWAVGERPSSVPQAPALVALVKRPQFLTCEAGGAGRIEFVPIGVHVTFLNPDGTGTMLRRKPWAKPDDPEPLLPKRKMLGAVGNGCVLLGAYDAGARLWVGEGNETVLSGMALGLAGAADVGVATLSLGNLQGEPKLWRNRTWPLHAMDFDPERPPFTIPGHRGRVTGLIDSDMAPLRGQRDQRTGELLGEAVVERRGGGIVRRSITGAERARICGELIVRGWRAAGVAEVDAVRAPVGMDFNDVVQAGEMAA